MDKGHQRGSGANIMTTNIRTIFASFTLLVCAFVTTGCSTSVNSRRQARFAGDTCDVNGTFLPCSEAIERDSSAGECREPIFTHHPFARGEVPLECQASHETVRCPEGFAPIVFSEGHDNHGHCFATCCQNQNSIPFEAILGPGEHCEEHLGSDRENTEFPLGDMTVCSPWVYINSWSFCMGPVE